MVIWLKKEVGKTWEICHENLSTYCLSFRGFTIRIDLKKQTTITCTHVATKNILGVRSPLDKI